MLASGGGTGETLELLESLSIGGGDGESQYTIVRSGNSYTEYMST
jgi:hypothetical protein